MPCTKQLSIVKSALLVSRFLLNEHEIIRFKSCIKIRHSEYSKVGGGFKYGGEGNCLRVRATFRSSHWLLSSEASEISVIKKCFDCHSFT